MGNVVRDGRFSELPKGYPFFQDRDEEEGVDETGLRQIVSCIRDLNPKLFVLQQLTGDL